MPFYRRRRPADGIIERQRAVEDGALDLAAIRHFAKGGGIRRRDHFRRDGFDGGKDRDFGILSAP